MNKTRQELYALLGDLPDRERAISARVVDRMDCQSYRLEKLVLDLNGIEPVPAYFASPLGAKGRLPTIVYNHAHGSEYAIGKEEIIAGRTFMQKPPYAEVFAGMGYATLCIDHWAFGERNGRRESELFKQMRGEILLFLQKWL